MKIRLKPGVRLSPLLKGDFDGHPFRGNQYKDSVDGVGESKPYQDAARAAHGLSAEARNKGTPAAHWAAAEAHKDAAGIAQRSLSTRSAVLTHLRLAEDHEAQAGTPSRPRYGDEQQSLADIIASRKERS